MDGSTDSGNIDDEIFHVLWCDVDRSDEKVRTRMIFFAVCMPQESTGKGLLDCMTVALGRLGITAIDPDTCKHLIGIGTMEQMLTLLQLV